MAKKKKTTKAASKHSSRKANRKAARRARRSSRTGAKRNGMQRRRSYKRNGMEGGVGMRVLKAFGAVMAGAAIAIGGMLLLSATSLSAMAQDGILIAGGVVIGGALIAMGHTHVGVAMIVGPVTLGLSRRVLTWGITARAQELIASIQGTAAAPAAAAPATAPAQGFYGFNPGGYLAASPDWTPGMAERSVRPDSLVNFTTPMAQYALG